MKKIVFRKRHEQDEFGGFTEWYLAYGNNCYALRITDLEMEGLYIRGCIAKTLLEIRKELRQMPADQYTFYISPL